MTHTQAAFEGIIDDFLQNPLEAPKTKDGTAARKIEVGGANSKKDAVGKMYETGADKWGDEGGIGMPTLGGVRVVKANARVSRVSPVRDRAEAHHRTSAHNDAQADLVDSLRTQMEAKKRTLQDRLRRRRKAAADGTGASSDAKDVDAEDAIKDDQELSRLDHSFAAIQRMVESYDDETVKSVRAADLVQALDALSAGQDAAHILPRSEVVDMGDVQRRLAHEQLASKVQMISANFNEENQKLDLMMKVQQARQRQSLQRKLLERQGAQSH